MQRCTKCKLVKSLAIEAAIRPCGSCGANVHAPDDANCSYLCEIAGWRQESDRALLGCLHITCEHCTLVGLKPKSGTVVCEFNETTMFTCKGCEPRRYENNLTALTIQDYDDALIQKKLKTARELKESGSHTIPFQKYPY